MLLVGLHCLVLVLQEAVLLIESVIVLLLNSKFVDFALQIGKECILMVSECFDDRNLLHWWRHQGMRQTLRHAIAGLDLREPDVVQCGGRAGNMVNIDWAVGAVASLVDVSFGQSTLGLPFLELRVCNGVRDVCRGGSAYGRPVFSRLSKG